MVKVSAIVYRGFNVADVKKETGIELDEALHQQWRGDSCIGASKLDAQK
ncbi:hypothetical protein [Pseudarthrobacter sp. H2]